ncbi:MAG TPA: vWA domain-containing protein [Tepidisphaeraceae bacterium]|nr:vWA domain-containing protein [Tepidisphaeraceae bacterium]
MTASRHLCALLVLVFATSFAFGHQPPVKVEADRPLVQIAILLDTSSSMSGLINQARSQLWTVVKEFARAKQGGQTPRLQVALYEYGHSNLSAADGYIRQVLPLTDDLDRVSEQLFALSTHGGEEYCGHAIQSATKGLAWSESPKVYKAIFIAGNEPFSQGTVDYKQSCRDAIARGIIVNTIHCGTEAEGHSTGWQDGAKLADGQALNIDQNRAIVAIAAPQDEEIVRLSMQLNQTYIAYGPAGAASQIRQKQQDALATAAPETGSDVQRSISKAQSLYSNASWDLVDATKEKSIKLEDIEAKDLPEGMRQMTPQQRKAHVEEQARKRGEIQKQINDLGARREKYVAEKRREEANDGADTLDAAMLKAVREQLTKKQFEVAEK